MQSADFGRPEWISPVAISRTGSEFPVPEFDFSEFAYGIIIFYLAQTAP